jgi:ABC-type glycerol-3-phosphate transport system substrate-binding protein
MKRLVTTAIMALAVSTLTVTTALAGEVVWWTPNWGEARAKELADKFMAANPGITIKMEITTSNGLPQRVLTALQSGAAPDIIEVQHPWVNGYANAGLVLPLTDVIGDTSDYNKAAITYDTVDGQIYGWPYRVEGVAVIYNVDMFKAAGLDPANPPQTWDEWMAAAKAMTKDGVYGFGLTGGGEVGNTVTRAVPLIWMNGGNLISDDQKTATINSPEAVGAVKLYNDFYKNGYAPDSTLQNDGLALRALFIAKKVAMYMGGQFDLPPIKAGDPTINVGAFPIPHPEGKDTTAIVNGWSYVIPKDAKNPDDAKKFLTFLNTTENMGFFTDTFPARTSSMALPRFQDPALKPFSGALATGRAVPNNPHWVDIGKALFDGIQRILGGDQDAQASMDQANEEIQALLDS